MDIQKFTVSTITYHLDSARSPLSKHSIIIGVLKFISDTRCSLHGLFRILTPESMQVRATQGFVYISFHANNHAMFQWQNTHGQAPQKHSNHPSGPIWCRFKLRADDYALPTPIRNIDLLLFNATNNSRDTAWYEVQRTAGALQLEHAGQHLFHLTEILNTAQDRQAHTIVEFHSGYKCESPADVDIDNGDDSQIRVFEICQVWFICCGGYISVRLYYDCPMTISFPVGGEYYRITVVVDAGEWVISTYGPNMSTSSVLSESVTFLT